MQPVLIISAVEQEVSYLVRSLRCERVRDRGFPVAYVSPTDQRPVVIAAAGIGKVNAASVASALIFQWQPELVINIGCAGAYPEGGLKVGDLALAVSEIFGDDGVITPEGWQGLEFIGIPVHEIKGERYFNEIPLSFAAAEKAGQLASALDITLRRGRFLTVSACSGTVLRGRELYDRFAPVCENMEGAAVALVAMQYGVDCLEVRGISNMVEDRDLSRWDIPLAVEQAQRFILKYLESY
ncbi:5'-methylthioadenosine/S-adenosylhomocysteine nucleosidase [Geobacter sp. OR-1]|uniref:futalosine hydrolase n=1 Tax=Geobacter sp. OR-1 TaxID=1266765 RepID=UPI000542399F|nr:futalosine hydrolase [Geobacter sp. OR-1]GAM08770.1 5'-methylthioadenosine/S-adenosylhomocysteine nucleosidase [Geobacter sp. OR-1]